MKKTNKSNRPEKKSPRVTAWIYDVINPILEVLPTELHFLEEDNWTWRFYNKKCEFIQPLKQYLAPSTWPNYEQFYESKIESFVNLHQRNVKLQILFDGHDNGLKNLEEKATRLFEYLDKTQEFVNEVNKCLNEWNNNNSNKYPGGAYPKEKFHMLMAENIINNRKEIPEHYSDSGFWALYKDRLKSFVDITMQKEVSSYGEALRLSDKKLVDYLKELRNKLCETFDLPAAPSVYKKENQETDDNY